MSGFVGILNLDGAPVDRALLERMTRALEFRGPDATGIWCNGAVGLGHTLLRTTSGAHLTSSLQCSMAACGSSRTLESMPAPG